MPHDIRDQIVDFVRAWSDQTEIPVCRFLSWIGIGVSKFHNWKQRFGKVNEHNAWVPRDHWLIDDEKQRICNFARANPLEGYRRLTFMMLDADVVACSPASVYRVLKAAGLLAGPSPKPSRKGTGFVQPLAAHDHWHIDISYLNIAGTFYFLCSVLDGYSRFIVHWEIREKMEESDIEIILQRARESHPNARPRIISDNGPQFIAKDFKEFIRVTGMTHVKTSPYYPESNGKIERWHKTLKGECIRILVPLTLDDARRLVLDYVEHYNTVRLHSAIGYVAPIHRLEGRDKEIFSQRDRKLAEAREHRRLCRQTQHQTATDTSEPARSPIDFDAVKAAISLATVLQLLGILTQTNHGHQHRGTCPFHEATPGTLNCFSANLEKNIFHCFKCHASGNALDLWMKANHLEAYEAASDLCHRLSIPLPLLEPKRNKEEEPVALSDIPHTMPSPKTDSSTTTQPSDSSSSG